MPWNIGVQSLKDWAEAWDAISAEAQRNVVSAETECRRCRGGGKRKELIMNAVYEFEMRQTH